MALVPVALGAVHDTVAFALPGTALTPVGTPGVVEQAATVEAVEVGQAVVKAALQ